MEQYKQEFIEFMVDSNVLKFGDFTLKSGRKSRIQRHSADRCDDDGHQRALRQGYPLLFQS